MTERIEKGALLRYNAADLMAWVARVTLATISSWSDQDLIDIGWFDSPTVKELYTRTNAGVWISKVNASGQLTEANSSTISSHVGYQRTGSLSDVIPRVSPLGYSPATALVANYQRRLVVIPFTSNAGGTLDADLDLSGTVGAQAGYFHVIDEIFFLSLDYGGASTPTMVFSTTSHNAFRTHGPLAVTGDNQVNKQLESIPIYYLNDDGEVVFLDTTTSDLGNAKNWLAIVKFHFET